MTTCTLYELADLALITPERGAVNFNTLHLLLRRILKETGIGKRTVKYKIPDADAFLRKLLEEGEISFSDLEAASGEFLDSDEAPYDFEDTSTNTDSDIWPGAEIGDLFTTVNELENKLEKVIRQMETIETDIVSTIRKINEDSEKRERKTVPDMDRDQFEEALEEIGEAIARLGNKLKQQEESQGESINEETLKKMCLKAAEEEIAKRQAVFNQGLQNLAIAIRNLQYIIKEIIDPEAAGITKCITCGRRGHLPNLEILSSIPGDPRADKKLTEFTRKEFAKRKDDKKKHQLKFTLLTLDNLKKGKRPVLSKLLQDQKESSYPDVDAEREEKLTDQIELDALYDIENATATFVPLRLTTDPSKSIKIISDAFHPKELSLSIVGEENKQNR